MKNSDLVIATELVVKSFEKLGIPYYIGGSVASSAYGIARSTMDIDIISDIKFNHVETFFEMLKEFYYIDQDMIFDAIRRCSSFNIIHLETMLKVDIFINKNRAYDIESFKRRREDTLDEEQQIKFYLVSPEDLVLNKLEWFSSGGCISERQWKDILGVLKVQQNSLDKEYLQLWAFALGLENLLKKALHDANLK